MKYLQLETSGSSQHRAALQLGNGRSVDSALAGNETT